MTQRGDCIFCRIIAGDMPALKVFEDEHSVAFMDINPATDGHTLVIPKAHAEDLLDIDAAILGVVTQTVQTVARGIYQALNPHGMRIAQFNGAAAGQTVFHYHVHLRPVYGDGSSHIHGYGSGDRDKIVRLAENIRDALS